VDAVRDCLKAGGYAAKSNEVEEGGTFLVAYEGRIFCVESDYQVAESALPYEAIGCGAETAMGSLFTTQEVGMPSPERIDIALKAAEAFSCGVRGPFIHATSAR
jgi:hypothetical protein